MLIKPMYKHDKFTCPNCGVVAKQNWIDYDLLRSLASDLYNEGFYDYRKQIQDFSQQAIEEFLEFMQINYKNAYETFIPQELSISKCQSCGIIALWFLEKMVFPRMKLVAPPNLDLNDDIKKLYIEAATILEDSPRGATALLRLALQKLLMQIGKEGKHLNADIKELVEGGLSKKIQQSLDILRVIGNNAVHPGQINLDDNSEVAISLFKILNIIAEEIITKPKEIDNLYNGILPTDAKTNIEKRDKKN